MKKTTYKIVFCTVFVLLSICFSRPHAISGPEFKLVPARIPPKIPESKLGKGKLLVADRKLLDPNFSQTVVLLMEYIPDGAMGVIINRPTKVKLSDILPDMTEMRKRPDTLYVGGPVGRNQMLMLVKTSTKPEGAIQVFDDVFLCPKLEVVQKLLADTKEGERFRIYAGYAGWAPRQLENELARGDWHIFQADADTVFDKPPSQIWPDLIKRSAKEYAKSEY
jgi:putative transcriptional regulator